MGLDDAQTKFATRLRTGEALAYSDEFAEAAHISIPRTLTATAAPPGLVMPIAAAPFGACDRCRAQCGYRGAALAMTGDPATVGKIKDAVAALEVKGLIGAEIESRWKQLIGLLHAEVGAFSALPSADPGRSDAAFCLFLHSLAIRTMRFSPSWPKSVATRLGIPAAEATE
jgi:hypothetical protein